MKKRHLLTGLWIAVSGLMAQEAVQKPADQSYVLDQQPLLYKPAKIGRDESPAGRTSPQVVAIMQEALQAQDRAGLCEVRKPSQREPAGQEYDKKEYQLCADTYYVLHLVRHRDGKPESIEDAWYVYTPGWAAPKPLDRWNDREWSKHFERDRMFGATKVNLLYVHYGIPAGAPNLDHIAQTVRETWEKVPGWSQLDEAGDDAGRRNQMRLWARLIRSVRGDTDFTKAVDAASKQNDLTAEGPWKTATEKFEELKREDLKSELAREKAGKLLSAFFLGGTGLVGPNGQDLSSRNGLYFEKAFLPIFYTLDVTKRTPSVLDNLRTVLPAFLPQFEISAVALKMDAGYAFTSVKANMVIEHPTSNLNINALRGESRRSIGSKNFINERKYWFDFSFAVPLRQLKELQFKDNTLAPNPVERSRIYGVVNIFPFGPVDTRARTIWRFAPQFLYGMALNRQPWSNHLFALGFGTRIAQPFAGVHLNRNLQPGSTEANPVYRWGTQLAVGVNIQASGLAALIKQAGK